MLERLQRVLENISRALAAGRMEPRLILYNMALSFLGTDASPLDEAPDEYGCAETVNAIYQRAYGVPIGGGTSTYQLYRALLNHVKFARVDDPLPGDIIISPTGYGANKAIPNGHTGYVGEGGIVMSNDSRTGTFEENFTIASWRRYFEQKGGYPVRFFRRV